MANINLAYALLGGLAIALLFSVYTDIRHRLIYNLVTLPIALAAPLFWAATGDFTMSSVGIHLLTGILAFLLFAIFFRLGMMGGGDVKLFAALSLWFPWNDVIRMIFYASLLGGVVTIIFLIIHKVRQRVGPPRIPYGVAISLAGLLLAGERIFNHYS
jgi:prepilin peptidase CpaA